MFRHTAGNTRQLVLTATGGGQVFSAGYDTIDQTQRRTITETVNGTSHIFGETALGTTQVTDNGARASYTRDPDGTPITQNRHRCPPPSHRRLPRQRPRFDRQQR